MTTNTAIDKIREIVGEGADLLGVKTIEFKPGAVVLLVATFDQYAEQAFVEKLRERMCDITKALLEADVSAVAVALPSSVHIRTFEVQSPEGDAPR
jgi:hypothetical protein